MQRCFMSLVLTICAGQAGATDAVAVDASGFIAFAHLDSDNNGYVSRVEARSVIAVERAFDAADANQDGLLNRREYGRVLEGRPDARTH